MNNLASLWAVVRNSWRKLTSMRTALILLFLLALAAIPGAVFPQRELNENKTLDYIAAEGKWGEFLDKLQFFDVFSSTWFTAIYVLLFISLIGCILPRTVEHYRAMRAEPVKLPRNLSRLPLFETRLLATDPEETAKQITNKLRGWRKITRTAADGTIEISAERGYTRETGNLLFHLALVALLVSIAVGKFLHYEGTRILLADGGSGLCNGSATATFDSFRAGRLVDGSAMAKFCLRVESFSATYHRSGQPNMYTARLRYQKADQITDASWKDSQTTNIEVNHPLRIEGDRIYLLGHGFAPTFTVTFPNGEKRTRTAAFRPDVLQTMLSSGALRIDPPGGLYPNADERRKNQIAIEGVFAPSARVTHGTLLTSDWPEALKPAVAIDIYRGDTGLDAGRPQNDFKLDQEMVNQGRLLKKERVNLFVGQQKVLDNGTIVRFDGYKEWVSVQVSHDPAQMWVLVSAIFMVLGLLTSLVIKRRRLWFRLVPQELATGNRETKIEIAGLARTDPAGWGTQFPQIVETIVGKKATG